MSARSRPAGGVADSHRGLIISAPLRVQPQIAVDPRQFPLAFPAQQSYGHLKHEAAGKASRPNTKREDF